MTWHFYNGRKLRLWLRCMYIHAYTVGNVSYRPKWRLLLNPRWEAICEKQNHRAVSPFSDGLSVGLAMSFWRVVQLEVASEPVTCISPFYSPGKSSANMFVGSRVFVRLAKVRRFNWHQLRPISLYILTHALSGFL